MKSGQRAKRLSIVMAAAAVMTTFAGTASAATAEATALPSDCHAEILGWNHTGATCAQSNGGWYQAIAQCQSAEGDITPRSGPWRQDGNSLSYCLGTETAISAQYATTP
ncbi:hypothetical protein DP939_37565 [Spongiactinospora rosea]|uniref:Uncharacterized protein n=1 Tax=Spongiactinospora rosea TaxID=2248750 RepID=A0A366LNN9_9ACTN|nr:hypothetical protein [Spongiactinospora rosea]RBQ15113.1 hypothetical protein DP939_37565 [Spongiactinospora rosea]